MLTFKGGNGSDTNEAIIIHGAKDELEGIEGEYIWLEEKYGKQDFDWELIDQHFIDLVGNQYDILKLKFADGIYKELWFNITEFYEK